MANYRFTFDGVTGLCEPYNGGAYIWWNGMGFHLSAATTDLRDAILSAQPR